MCNFIESAKSLQKSRVIEVNIVWSQYPRVVQREELEEIEGEKRDKVYTHRLGWKTSDEDAMQAQVFPAGSRGDETLPKQLTRALDV